MSRALPALSPRILEILRRLGHADASEASVAGTAGSGRVFFRIGAPPRSHILLCSHAGDADYDRFLSVSRALRAAGLPVPEVHGSDDAVRQVVLEDLGDVLLWHRARAATEGAGDVEVVYRPALEALAAWQRRGTPVIAACPALADRVFDREALLWETDYFSRRFAREERGISEARLANPALRAEFAALAARVEAHPRVLMHRDCQSQNLMWRDDRIWFIDFQGARSGSRWYDLASLLWDPYVALPCARRRALFEAWLDLSPPGISSDEAWREILDAALQRVMQALGAFAFLSREKGLPWFRPHMEPALRALQETLVEKGNLPETESLVRGMMGLDSPRASSV